MEFDSLANGDVGPLLEYVEKHILAEHVEGPDGELETWKIAHWYECALQLVFLYSVHPILPPGWTLRQELRSPGGARRADLVFTTDTKHIVMVELKYVNLADVSCEQLLDETRLDACIRQVASAEDVTALEFRPSVLDSPVRVADYFCELEFGGDVAKFCDTAERIGADQAFLVVGVGHRLGLLASHASELEDGKNGDGEEAE